jgi:cellulose synthase/poly-beta-1,6-N-acetylglucosamine synthase-like glycosyltransferase
MEGIINNPYKLRMHLNVMNPIYLAGVYIVWFFSTYFIVLTMLILFTKKDELYEKRTFDMAKAPMVSVIVPAYNEQGRITDTINSLKAIEYDRIEFIIINDGSTDSTADEIRRGIGSDERFRFVDRQQNKGKAYSLNQGIFMSTGEYIACMDADSIAEKKVFQKSLPYFDDGKIGAVTVAVQVRNPKSLVHRIIEIEYIIGLSLYLKVLGFLGCIFVTPGPFSIYRADVLRRIGGFDITNITEDLEIAYRIHKSGYSIVNCMETKVQTICPPTFKGIYNQRKRWYGGALQTLAKHKDVMFSKRYGMLGFFIPFNYFLIFSGMMIFLSSLYLIISNVLDYFWKFRLTGWNFFSHLSISGLDPLRIGNVTFIGLSSLFLALFLVYVGLRVTKHKYKSKMKGILGYPLMFFLYQAFWIGAIVSLFRKKKINWR